MFSLRIGCLEYHCCPWVKISDNACQNYCTNPLFFKTWCYFYWTNYILIAFSPKIFDNAFFPQNEMQTTTREMLYPNPTVSPHLNSKPQNVNSMKSMLWCVFKENSFQTAFCQNVLFDILTVGILDNKYSLQYNWFLLFLLLQNETIFYTFSLQMMKRNISFHQVRAKMFTDKGISTLGVRQTTLLIDWITGILGG